MNGFIYLPKLIKKARTSKRWLMVLNRMMRLFIPFNGPHGIKILEIGDHVVRTMAPYQRKNFNHLKGIHACAIATIGEFSAGLILLSQLDPSRYRLIMSHLDIEYLYQAKKEIVAETRLEEAELENDILNPLREKTSIYKAMNTLVTDIDGKKIARVKTKWQIKSWDRVKTKT